MLKGGLSGVALQKSNTCTQIGRAQKPYPTACRRRQYLDLSTLAQPGAGKFFHGLQGVSLKGVDDDDGNYAVTIKMSSY